MTNEKYTTVNVKVGLGVNAFDRLVFTAATARSLTQ